MKIKLEPKIFHFRGVCLISKTPEESEMLMALWLGKALCTVLSKVQAQLELVMRTILEKRDSAGVLPAACMISSPLASLTARA